MYQRILVPIDGSPTSARGLDEAIALARSSGGRLRLVHVVDELSLILSAGAMGNMTGDVITASVEGGRKVLEDAQERAEAKGVAVETLLIEGMAGRICDHVIEDARRWPADLIVIGTHGRRGVGRWLLGSDAEQILRMAPVPVLLVRSEPSDGGA